MRSHIRRLGATMGATALLSIGALAAAGTASASTMPMAKGWSQHHSHHHHKEFECHFKHLGKWGGAFALICHEEGHHHHHHP